MMLLSLSLFMLSCLMKASGATIKTVDVKFFYKKDANLTCDISDPITFRAIDANQKNTSITPDTTKYVFDSSSKTLTIKSLRRADFKSKYYCSNAAGDVVNYNIQTAPYLYQVDTLSETCITGYSLKLACYLIVGNETDQPLQWIWAVNNRTVSGDRISVTNYNDRSELLINNTQLSDKGVYYCTISNTYGSASRNVTVKIKSNLAPLWPFLGTILQLLVIALCTGLYEKIKGTRLFKSFKTTPMNVYQTGTQTSTTDIPSDRKELTKYDGFKD